MFIVNMSEERFLPDHIQFFAELMGDSDSDSKFEGFDEPDLTVQQPPEDDLGDILERWEEGERQQPELGYLQVPGATTEFGQEAQPIEYFDSLFPPADIDNIAHEINKYADQRQKQDYILAYKRYYALE